MWPWSHELWMASWWIVLAAVVLWLVWSTTHRTIRSRRPQTPEEMLRRRYAGGEIDNAEYERRLARLRRRPS